MLRGLAALAGTLGAGRMARAAGSDTEAPLAPLLGEVVLSVRVFGGEATPRWQRDFDLDALAALPQHTLVATTPWHGQPRRFTGPLLADVLDAAGARGRRLVAAGLNDYRAEIPLADLRGWPVIVALRVDGHPVAVRDRGPLMIVYPFDDDPALRSARYYGRAVWQLRTLDLH